MHIQIDSDLNCLAKDQGCEPVVFVPEVNLYELEDPNIIEAF